MSQTTTTIRLDVWLDVACLYRTRSEAQRACQGGKVEVNGQSSKPHRQVKIGDQLRLSRPYGRKQTLTVAGLADKHVPRAEARLLYQDTTPPPSAEEQALLDMMRLAGPRRRYPPAGSPDKRERRRLRREKEGG